MFWRNKSCPQTGFVPDPGQRQQRWWRSLGPSTVWSPWVVNGQQQLLVATKDKTQEGSHMHTLVEIPGVRTF